MSSDPTHTFLGDYYGIADGLDNFHAGVVDYSYLVGKFPLDNIIPNSKYLEYAIRVIRRGIRGRVDWCYLSDHDYVGIFADYDRDLVDVQCHMAFRGFISEYDCWRTEKI